MSSPAGTGIDNTGEEHLDYYPAWLDNLADDIILQAVLLNGEVQGAELAAEIIHFARSHYAFQDFRFYGRRGDLWLEDYRSHLLGTEHLRDGGVEIWNFVVVYFNDKGQANQIVMNHRPWPAALVFSKMIGEQFADEIGADLCYRGEVSRDQFMQHDLARGIWPDQ